VPDDLHFLPLLATGGTARWPFGSPCPVSPALHLSGDVGSPHAYVTGSTPPPVTYAATLRQIPSLSCL